MKRPITFEEADARDLLSRSREGIHTFSNGSDWDSWSSGNCDQCRFFDRDCGGGKCAFEWAAQMDQVSPELATIFGWKHVNTQYGPRSGWTRPAECPFFAEPPDDGQVDPLPPDPDPAQLTLILDPTEDLSLADAHQPTEGRSHTTLENSHV